MLSNDVTNLLYTLAAVGFILDLKWMAHPKTAVKGNLTGVLAMGLAIVATITSGRLDWSLVVIAVAVGTLVGAVAAAKVKMTAMPEMVGLFNGFGGGASALVAGSAVLAAAGMHTEVVTMPVRVATALSGIIGSVTFFGSYVAFGKLAEFLAVRWRLYLWQRLVKYGFSGLVIAGGLAYAAAEGAGVIPLATAAAAAVIAGALLLRQGRFPGMGWCKIAATLATLGCAVVVVEQPLAVSWFWLLIAVAGILGVLLTISIGGADMPVVIALLNSYSGLAAAATGFLISNTVLIIAGSLVGASGVILTKIMCKAMNRSLGNVIFGSLGPSADQPDAESVYKTVKSTTAEEVAMVADGVSRVVIVPGYGMAVAQAQHVVRDLAAELQRGGASVEYAIHPVAGRMPGHMNVLLAEADVPYDALVEMDAINPTMSQVDLALVVGANDVVNPVARTDPTSPISGMPIIDVDKAQTVVVIKRSLSPGFAGIPNPLFAADNTLMLFGDAKQAILDLQASLKEQ